MNNNLVNDDSFVIADETGKQQKADLITILKIDDIEYAVYSIDNENGESDIFCQRYTIDVNGVVNLVSIDNVEEREKVFNIIGEMFKGE